MRYTGCTRTFVDIEPIDKKLEQIILNVIGERKNGTVKHDLPPVHIDWGKK